MGNNIIKHIAEDDNGNEVYLTETDDGYDYKGYPTYTKNGDLLYIKDADGTCTFYKILKDRIILLHRR